MLKKPEKHYNNFEDARWKCSYYKEEKLKDKKWFPCLKCRGDGIIIDPSEEPDIIEGHKLSRRIKCPKCKGSGIGTRKEIMEEYRKWNNKYKEEMKEYRNDEKLVKNIFNRLSKEEVRALNRHYWGY